MKPLIPSSVAGAVLLALAPAATAAGPESTPVPYIMQPSQSDFGGVGLLQMPTARMNKEGEFSINGFFNDEYRRYSLSLQLYPWLETTIRYTDIRNRLYSGVVTPGFSGNQTLKDKGVDFKFRLWQESRLLPEVSLGVRDLAGTGLFDGEFLAASKRYGPLDFTLGYGWGYLGTRDNVPNVFCEGMDKYCVRTSETKGTGGDFDVNSIFKGPTSLFGGVEYQTPWRPLRLKLEYDGNDYSQDNAGIAIVPDSPFNAGAVYRLQDWLDLHLGFERGNTLSLGFTMRTNFNTDQPSVNDEPRPSYQPAGVPQAGATDWASLQQELAANAGYDRAVVYQPTGQSLRIEAEQGKYRHRATAHDRAGMILANRLPDTITSVELVETRNNLPLTSQVYDMEATRRVADVAYPGARMEDAITPAEPSPAPDTPAVAGARDRYTFGLSPVLQQSFGGPESFYMYQIGVNANLDAELHRSWLASSSVYINLLDNYDKFNFTRDALNSPLPRVRTLIREYISDNPVRLSNLQLTGMDRLAPDWYGQVYAGYLEMMYAGAGAEVLYRPRNASWALGANANWVRQRDYDSQFGMLDYTAPTGHVTWYQELPLLEDTLLQLHAGQYLAKDKGVTFDISHKFDSGVIAGAFATFTDVSAEDFGEGSFNKGFYLSIPFELMTIRPSNDRAQINWVPITRDGGQMLGRKHSLYHMTDARSPYFDH